MRRELGGLRVICVSNMLSSFCEIIGRMSKLNFGPEQQPIGAGLAKRHSDAASVQNSSASDSSIELHVRMTADEGGDVESFKEREQALFGREAGEHFRVTSRGGVTKQDLA